MPDLIIKPTNTEGNKVIIQDQAGGAVLTTADSGATLSNVTVTSGNLSNSALVYPSGHIVKVTSHSVANTIELGSNQEALESDANDITVSCTVGNILHITIAGGYCYSSGSGFHFGPGMQIKETGQSNITVHGGGLYARSDGGSYDNDCIPSIIYSHTAITTSVTIKAALRSNSNATAYWACTDAAGRGKRRYLIMESQS
jgi:hypothetical protein